MSIFKHIIYHNSRTDKASSEDVNT